MAHEQVLTLCANTPLLLRHRLGSRRDQVRTYAQASQGGGKRISQNDFTGGHHAAAACARLHAGGGVEQPAAQHEVPPYYGISPHTFVTVLPPARRPAQSASRRLISCPRPPEMRPVTPAAHVHAPLPVAVNSDPHARPHPSHPRRSLSRRLPPAEKAWEAIISAPEVARGYSQQIVETEHLFKALLEQPNGLARRILSKAGLNPTQVRRRRRRHRGRCRRQACIVLD